MRSTIRDPKRDLELAVDYVPAYGFAACLAEFHPVYSVKLTEASGGRDPDSVEIRVPEIDYRLVLPLRDGRTDARHLPLDPRVATRLESLTHGTNTHLLISLGGNEVARLPATMLPSANWPHLRECRIFAAAHALPGDDAVFRTVVEAAEFVGGNGERSLPETVAADPEGAASIALESLYTYLATRCEIEYEEPRVEIDPWCEVSSQPLRAPHEVVGSGGVRAGKGNCLDLSLMFAGCLESLGLHPIVFFTGSLAEAPSHAFVGCWSEGGRRFRPLLTDAETLRAQLKRGDLLALEATGVCGGAHRLTFEEASRAASRHAAESSDIHALDVVASRPPHGRVRPLRIANAAVVQQACWKGDELRKSVQAEARETLHILFGLCAAEGEVTSRLLRECGSSAKRIRRIIETSLPQENHAGPGRETNNYRLCLEAARLNARNREAPVVEEPDILWAVLDSNSRNVRKVLAAAGCDYSVLLAALSRQWSRPRQATVSRYFGPVSSG